MSLKEEFKKIILDLANIHLIDESNATSCRLENRVNYFLDWCANKKYNPEKMKNFIEKMAIWYELRYPDDEICRLIPINSRKLKEVNKIMFIDNQYIKKTIDDPSITKKMNWAEFYNTNVFINSLSNNELWYIKKPKYAWKVYWNYGYDSACLYLSARGIIEKAKDIEHIIPNISDKSLEGKDIKEVVALIEQKGILLPKNNGFTKAIEDYDDWFYQKEEMLNCVMYRIIERGGNRIGPRRAFLFAKEFNRDINIPMKYAVDFTDLGLRNFINEYIKAGGSKYLNCYLDYFSKTGEKLDTITIQELILTKKPYTLEETKLHQRLIDCLMQQIDLAKLNQEEIKSLKLHRK